MTMTRIITPGLFLVAAMSLTACTDSEDDLAPAPPDQPDVAACCANETPYNGEPLNDTVDFSRRAYDRLDLLRRMNLRR
jgi:hypothetical protein